jgi:hypothetical protein
MRVTSRVPAATVRDGLKSRMAVTGQATPTRGRKYSLGFEGGFEGPYGLVRDRLAIARQFRMAKQRSFIRQLRSTV